MKATFKPKVIDYIYCGKMETQEEIEKIKEFCGNNVQVTFEYAPGIGHYWCVILNDYFNSEKIVPCDSYIVKFDDIKFISFISYDFKSLFDICKEN